MAKVNSWLDEQNLLNNPERNSKIKALKKNLDFNRLKDEEHDEEQLLLIPIMSEFEPGKNMIKGLSANLVLSLNKDGGIKSGNIVQYRLENEQRDAGSLLMNLSFIHKGEKIQGSGEFAFYNITGFPLYKSSYKKGTLLS
jgi:hypothetical protein